MPVRCCTFLAYGLTLSLYFSALASQALAQTTPSDKALAETLFDRGLQLMRDGKFDEACPQLEQSQAIERGIGTLLYLAECYEKLGRTASAWAMFREAASAARAEGQPDRAKVGNSRADRLEPLLSKLTINVAGASTTQGLLVLRNGQPVPPGVWGVAIPVDPGEQRIEARAPGRTPWNTALQLPTSASSVHVDVPELAIEPSPPPLAAPPVASAPLPLGPQSAPEAAVSASVSPAPADVQPANRWQKPVGLVIGGVGIAGMLVGGYFGLRAIGKNNDADELCPDENCPPGRARTLDNQAHTAANLANGFVIGGAALLVGGAVLFFTAPSSEALEVGLSSTGSGPALHVGGHL